MVRVLGLVWRLDLVVVGSKCGRPSPQHLRSRRLQVAALGWCKLLPQQRISGAHGSGNDAPTKAGFY